MSTPGPANISQTNVPDANGIAINVLVQWSPPSDGGYPITSYRIQYSLTNYIAYITKELVLANAPSAVDPVTGRVSYLITELIKGGKYQIRVSAVNGFGSGQYSNLLYAFPGTIPTKLDSTTFEIYASRGSTTATLSWIKPYDGGYPIVKYIMRYRSITIDVVNKVPTLSSIRAPASAWTDPPIDISATLQAKLVTGLTNGTYYQFQIAAVNEVGTAEYNGPVVVKPGDIPGPFIANISGDFLYSVNAHNNGRIFLEWAPPAYDGGYDLENYVIQYKASDDVYFTKRNLPLTQRQITSALRTTPALSKNIVLDYYGDLSANPPILIQTPLRNDIRYSIRVGVQNDVGIRWVPERQPTTEIYATVIPNTFSKPVLDLNATIADQTAKLSWRWSDASLNNGYPFANYFVVRYRPYNDLYWHELVYPHSSEKLDVNATLNGYAITVAETGRDYINPNLFTSTAFQGDPYHYTNAVRDTSTNVYDFLDPLYPPFNERQPLVNGTTYDFQVAAVNHILRGPDMGIAIGEYATVRQTPGRVPDPPTVFRIQRGLQEATLFWTTSGYDGGYPITGYRIRVRPISSFDIILSTGDYPLSEASARVTQSVITSYNRNGVGTGSKNTSVPTIASRCYIDPSAGVWNAVTYVYSNSTFTSTLPFKFFTPGVRFDVAISAGNALGYGSELYMTDIYSTKPYSPNPPENVTVQMIKSSTISNGSGALFLSWVTPQYFGGSLTEIYGYEIQYALTEQSPAESNPDPVIYPNPAPDSDTWQPLNLNQQMFGEYASPSNTKTPGTLISATYSIFASRGGMIGTAFIQWIRIRSIAKTLGAGTADDQPSLWAVCGVVTLD